MDTNGNCIESGADKLLLLINNLGELSLSEAAFTLKMDKETISNWADILAENKLIKIKITLNSRHYLSLETKENSSFFNDIIKFKKSYHGTIEGREKELIAKDAEINKKLKQMDQKLIEMRELKKVQMQLRRYQSEISEKEKKLTVLAEKNEISLKQILDEKNTVVKTKAEVSELFEKVKQEKKENDGYKREFIEQKKEMLRMHEKLNKKREELALTEKKLITDKILIEKIKSELKSKDKILNAKSIKLKAGLMYLFDLAQQNKKDTDSHQFSEYINSGNETQSV